MSFSGIYIYFLAKVYGAGDSIGFLPEDYGCECFCS